MTTIENKKTEVPVSTEDTTKLNYSDLIGLALNNQVEGGYSVDDMEDRLRIKACTTPGTKSKFELDPADVIKLQEIVKVSRWGILHDDIVAFKNYIAEIK